ncbi:uncharacterized protein LOC142165930 [Nicotiana tabacum]|uniref:Uncharacterized protein LOC142165930 n=1 Tax=Nicotiana tabacum TaxID=4097 RepID=A0AC58S5Z5_TOBAC
MNVRGPKSYEDLRYVNGEPCNTFRESVEKRGMLQCDNSLIECMLEATSYQMPHSLRGLFATLLVYCNPVNPRELWEQFEEPMSEDHKLLANIGRNEIRLQVLNHINDILHSMDADINDYKIVQETIRPSTTAKEAKEVHFERTIIVNEQDILFCKKLNRDQIKAYNTIIERIFSCRAGAFFIDAAFILPGGRTAHSRFKIPININNNFSCNSSKQSALACLIREAKLIGWDEVSMANKRTIQAFDLLLKDLMDTNTIFGGKVVVFGGDFRLLICS